MVTAHGRMLQAWEEYRILLLEGVRAVLGEEAAENFELRVRAGAQALQPVVCCRRVACGL